jgi:putative transposase
MIERHPPMLSSGAQCRLLSISRSSFCYAPQGETEVNLALMQLIDRQFLETPFYGVRQITFYNHQQPHDALGGQPPAVVYFKEIETEQQGQRVA